MATLSDMKIKEATAGTTAITTDNVPGIIYYAIFTGATVGDKLEVLNGATNVLTLITSIANEPVEYKPPKGEEARFTTDIDATITKTGDAFATFHYREIT